MDRFQFFLSCIAFDRQELSVAAIEQVPHLLQETMYTVYTVGIPWLRQFNRAEEHFVHTQCICSEAVYNHIGVNHVIHRLTHLFDSPSANVFSIFQYEFGCVIFRTPVLESLNIENIVLHNVYVYVDRSNIVLVFQAKRNKCIGIFNTINKVTATLNHTLVNQFLEWLFFYACAHIEQELVPEARVDKMSGSVFCTTYIQIYILPIVIGLS